MLPEFSCKLVYCIQCIDKENIFVIDPSIRFEMSINEPQDVNNGKRNVYESCVDYLKDVYI